MEIKVSEVRFRELFNYISSGVAVYEAKDNGNDFIFKDFNQAGERIENIKKEDLLGKSVLEMFPGVKEFGLFDVFKRVWETGKSEHYPVSLYKDESIISWRENYVYRLPSGEIVAVYNDITERKQAEEELFKREHELNIRNQISRVFLTIPDDEMYGEVLQVILAVTESKYGIFGYVDDHDVLFIPSMTRDIWEQCQISEKTIIYSPDKWSGIWGRALMEKRSLYANEGLRVPEGHIPVTKVLVVPIMYHGYVIGLLEVANKETDYNEKDQELLESIADYLSPILNARLQRDRLEKERMKAEKALQDSEKFSSNLLNNSPLPILVINPDTSVRYVNPALETLTGFSSEEIVGRKIPYPWWTEERIQQTGEDLKKAMRIGVRRLEELFQKKNGERFWVEITSVPIIENGVFKYYLASWVDVTYHKQADKALRESEGKLNAMLESIGDHMTMINKDLNIIWANKIAKEVFGNDIVGKKCYEVYHQRKEPCKSYPFETSKAFKCVTLQAFQDEKIHNYDTHGIDKDGKMISHSCTVNIALRDKDGKPTAALEICRDMTKYKLAELAMIERGKELENKTKELEEANAALGAILKYMEEDKKNLENKVVANVKELVFPYIEKMNNSRLNDQQMVYLKIIKSNLKDIITPFLHQLSSKYSDLTPNEIQVAGLVKEGKTTKDIAELLNSSIGAINFHRNNLRKKLGLRNKKTNLRTFLLSLT